MLFSFDEKSPVPVAINLREIAEKSVLAKNKLPTSQVVQKEKNVV